jgi:hypothetical protein
MRRGVLFFVDWETDRVEPSAVLAMVSEPGKSRPVAFHKLLIASVLQRWSNARQD